jgi:hypothetical protein
MHMHEPGWSPMEMDRDIRELEHHTEELILQLLKSRKHADMGEC